MKKYAVMITPTAEAHVAQAFAYIHQQSPLNAERWIRGLYRAIHALEDFAGYARAPESDYLGVELRHKIFKSHRIIYSVDQIKKQIYVHYVWHGARRPVGEPPQPDD
ncbi:MAG TPA: type II toxin-antitoxin system RelE/ParE family toxin [Tepidisphaeraceae bacterium]|jgi:plasmid stabilization system protein ParE